MSMLLLLWLLPVLLAAVCLWLATMRTSQKSSRVLAEAAAGLLLASLPFVFMAPFTPITKGLLAVLQICALLLPARLIFGRLEQYFVRQSTRLAALAYTASIALAVSGFIVGNLYPGVLGAYQQRLVALLCCSLLVAVWLLYGYMRAARRYRLVPPATGVALKDLPTVSVCIPARNETHALQDCLASVIASGYPKLEILVLDDCSHDTTSRIIKSFAQDGVRFIKGDTPAEGWLGKNQAMQTLAAQANGNYIVFIDVDTRLSPNSITDMVMYALGNKTDMLAVLPYNRLGVQPGALLTPLRNFWQMVLPITRRNVPVASQCWLVRAQALKSLGGFGSVARKIVPEESFAVRLAARNAYRFVAGNTALGVTTAKHWNSLYESSVRVLYPTYKRQPLIALAAAAGILLIGVLPFGVLAWQLVFGASALLWPAVAACMALFAVYALVLGKTHPYAWPLATLVLPLVLIQEVIFIVASMLKYEFGRVDWKGRNVCYEVITPFGQPPVPGLGRQRQPRMPESTV